MSCGIHTPGYDEACHIIPLIPGKSVVAIDVGCGSGIKMKAVKRHIETHNKNVHTIGIDPAGDGFFLDEFTQEDVRTVKPYKGTADLVICMRADDKDPKGVIQACVQLLKPHGFLIMDGRSTNTMPERIKGRMFGFFKPRPSKFDIGRAVLIMSKHEAFEYIISASN